MTQNVRAGKAREEQAKARKALAEGKIVHLFDTNEPHLTEVDSEPCWCDPDVQQYDSGGVLFVHKKVSWQ